MGRLVPDPVLSTRCYVRNSSCRVVQNFISGCCNLSSFVIPGTVQSTDSCPKGVIPGAMRRGTIPAERRHPGRHAPRDPVPRNGSDLSFVSIWARWFLSANSGFCHENKDWTPVRVATGVTRCSSAGKCDFLSGTPHPTALPSPSPPKLEKVGRMRPPPCPLPDGRGWPSEVRSGEGAKIKVGCVWRYQPSQNPRMATQVLGMVRLPPLATLASCARPILCCCRLREQCGPA